MKRTLMATLLGLSMCTTAFGDGVIMFSNYYSTSYQQVTWGFGAGALTGTPIVDPHVELQLFWQLGDETSEDSGTFYHTANAGVTAFIDPTLYPFGGSYGGPNQILTGWTPTQTVTFGVMAHETAGPWVNLAFGQSALWTETAAAVLV